MHVVRTAEWELASPTAQLDAARGLGELSELPPEPRLGDWCTIVVAAEDWEFRWTFVAREHERATSIFADRRRARSSPLGDALCRANPPGAGARRRAGGD